MEDGDISEMEVSASIKAADESNDLLNKMANYPDVDVEVTVIKNKNNTECSKTSESSTTKVNGESEKVNSCYSDDEEEFSSDDDALIIDEDIKNIERKGSVNNKRLRSPSPRANFKGFKKRIIAKSYHSVKIVNEIKKYYQLNDSSEEQKQGELNATITKDSITQCHVNVNDSDIKTGCRSNDNNCTLTNEKLKKSLTAATTTHIEPPPLKHKQHVNNIPSLIKSSGKRPIKKRPSQNLTEYAQYLGLQPAVKFKCVKCSESSFPSLSALNDHQRQCLLVQSTQFNTKQQQSSPVLPILQQQQQPPSSTITTLQTPSTSSSSTTTTSSTNFRVTRKVFLCSSCGTYYENCNLFLHMREVHRRYICLYCLGMFSLPEKLSHHLVTKHNCSPNHYSSAEDFLSSYSESCFLVCCHCERVFSERDNFYEHVCAEKRIKLITENTNVGVGIGVGIADQQQSLQLQQSNTHNNQKQSSNNCSSGTGSSSSSSNKSIHPKSQKHKAIINKSLQQKTTAITSVVQHITADSTNTTTSPLLPVDPIENEDNHNNTTTTTTTTAADEDDDKTGGHFLADICKNILPENLAPPADMSDNTNTPEKSEINDKNDTIDDDEKTTIVTETETETETNELSNHSIVEDVNEIKNEEPPVEEKHESDSEIPNVEKMDTSVTPPIDDDNEKTDELEVEKSDNENNNKEEEEEEEQDEEEEEKVVVVEETRKVPKVTLKLPPQSLIYSENESDDSEKLTMEVDANDSDNDCDETKSFNNESEKPLNGIDDNDNENENENEKNHSDLNDSDDDSFQVAGDEVPIIELELDQPLDKFNIEDLIKTCLSATIPTCIYCNHARKIAVNGKQLGLHAIAEHRFSAIVNSITAEELIPKNFVQRIKESLDEIESIYFSLEEQEKIGKEEMKEDGIHVTIIKHSYECFQCRFVTLIHKELYLHNRKMHAKTILLCIMCKSNFYSYSELICHLCPGNYVLNSETKFRCCMCDSNNLPSAFRLMVHLRKKHHTCDVCLEGCNNQSKLSNHVWKHKLHHLCYRCGIAYRNKPDITKHLFWKHGTESVLCKKCLQKKWPHVYHFCVPPLSFVCEECNFSFSKAVYLKVHKRLHINEKPHACLEENCGQTFISKKLLLKHEMKHREPVPIETSIEPVKPNDDNNVTENNVEEKVDNSDNKESIETTKENNSNVEKEPGSPEKEESNKLKSIIDVYDLPALNLSESDSDSEDEKSKMIDEKPENLPNILPATNDENSSVVISIDEEQKPVPILDGIWDNFKNYQATIEKNILNTELSNTEQQEQEQDEEKIQEEECIPDINVILADHDYCLPQNTTTTTIKDDLNDDDIVMKTDETTTGLDHDYCSVLNSNKVSNPVENRPKTPENTEKKKGKTPKKKSSSSSDSSSDSDSSSCTCGSNCSCSSSSGSSSSSSSSSDSDSSSSEGKRRIAARRERRKERAKRKKESETSHVSAVDVVATEDPVPSIPAIEIPIEETDLETDETETDEDFYDEYPQRLVNKILAEKRNQLALLASVAPVSNGTILECSRPSTPSMPEESTVPKKKVKSKKRKKKSRSSTPKQEVQQHNIPDYLNHHHHHHHNSPMQVVQCQPSAPIIQPPVPSPLSIHSIPPTPQIQTVPPLSLALPPKSQILSHQNTPGSGSETETSVRSSKRRRVPNKFYGYSSDDDTSEKPPTAPVLKWRKADLPTPPSHVTGSPQLVPPITIKNIPSPAPVVEPIRIAPIIVHHQNEVQESDSETEEIQQHRKSATDSSDDNRNDDSDSDTGQLHISQPQPQVQVQLAPPPPPQPQQQQMQLQRQSQSRPPLFHSGPHHSHSFKQGDRNENLYCYCQCPYDEVSEMIACDGKDCAIEWFHFECVGIMVPPKGKWFCPDCRKRNTQRSDFIQI